MDVGDAENSPDEKNVFLMCMSYISGTWILQVIPGRIHGGRVGAPLAVHFFNVMPVKKAQGESKIQKCSFTYAFVPFKTEKDRSAGLHHTTSVHQKASPT